MIKPEIKMIGFEPREALRIKRNVEALLSTPAGTCGCARDYGINMGFIDMPPAAVENLLSLEIIEKLAIYEPRAELLDFTGETTQDGVKYTCVIGPSEERDEDGSDD